MQLIDTHSHIYAEEFDTDRVEALARARERGITRLLLPAIDSESHERILSLAQEEPLMCRPMMGLHPTSVNENPRWREELAQVEQYLAEPPQGIRFCAVGEIGLDFYWSQESINEQTEAFVAQLRMAAERDLPVAIHTRAAWEQMSSIIASEYRAAKQRGERLRGVFHAYSEDAATYRQLKELTEGNFYFGIGGVVTYKKSIVAEAVREMALEDLILETDCPYLTPVPHRGTRNESAYVSHTAQKVAELQGISVEQVADQTTRNAATLFGINSEISE